MPGLAVTYGSTWPPETGWWNKRRIAGVVLIASLAEVPGVAVWASSDENDERCRTGEVFGTGSAFAAAGAGDPTFGQGGKIIISLPDNNVIANDAVLQLDGKIVVAAVLMPTVATLNQFATAPFGVFASSVACEAGRRDVDIAAGLLSAEGQSRPEVQQPGL